VSSHFWYPLASTMKSGPPSTRTISEATSGGVLRVVGARLHVQRGPDKGRRAHLDRPTFVIGTGDTADMRLKDRTVSREHVRLTLLPSGVRVRDDGSKNGTRVGTFRLGEILVADEARIELGSTLIALHVEGPPLDLPLSASATFGGALGVSPVMRHLFAVLEQAAPSEATVLLEGESGVGKDVLARAIHARSARSDGPFVAVDCTAIPAALFESELFGHLRGAFTGANEERRGLFEEANGGTLFLDEVGELPKELQSKLLRALEQREIRAVGARAPKKIDVRVIAATNRRLGEAADRGEFRADLFYRLAVVRITVPPLRERTEDIMPLANAFLRAHRGDAGAAVPKDLEPLLLAHSWPGNVRELRNVVERLAVLGAAHVVSGLAAPPPAQPQLDDEDLALLPYHEARRRVVDRFERAYIPRVLERAGGVVTRAASLAELARPSLYRMMDRQGLPRKD
jgi:transcriptional regulator with PAS, ATPase and Fis domain